MKTIKFLFLVFGVQFFLVSCFREDVPSNLKDAIDYGVSKISFYKNVSEFNTGMIKQNKKLKLNILNCKNDLHDQTYYVMFEKIKGLNIAINENDGKYYFAGYVSADDVKLAKNCGPAKKYSFSVDSIKENDFLKYFNANNNVVNNVKKQLPIFFNDSNESGKTFYISPFGSMDSEVRVYWKETNKFISVFRGIEDWDLKKIRLAQTRHYDPVNQNEVEKTMEFGVKVSFR